MNPSALQQALGRFGQGAFNTGASLVGAATNTGMDIANSVVHNLAQDFAPPQTRNLPPAVQSPIATGQVVPHQVAPSWLQYGMQTLAGNLLPMQQGATPQNPRIGPPAPSPQPSLMDSIRQRFATPQPSVGLQMQNGQLPAGLTTGQQATPPPVTPTPTTHWMSEAEAEKNAPTPALDPLEQKILPIFQKHGINPAVALGITQAEGGNIGQNNPWNMNATDANPTGASNYPTIEAGAESTAQNLVRLLKKAGYTGTDAPGQLQAIESAGYAGPPATWKQRSIDEARRAGTHGAGENYDYWHQFVQSTKGYQNWANR